MSVGIRSAYRQTIALSKTNNTLADVPGLAFPMPGNTIFYIDLQLFVTAAAAPGQKVLLVGQDTGTIETTQETIAAAAVVNCSETQGRDGGANAFTGLIRIRGLVRNITAVATTFKLQAAQSVTDVSAVTFTHGFMDVIQMQ